ncbi:MAG: hypothetical protein QM621_02370 [Aeromicrobium sp.]|uniref:hypothetical protein n=1 Tax=Aeromicrobium sp. TaxID=1871063 RepID=UPI0039E59010
MRLTNPLWYLAAALIALGGSMVGTAIAAGSWDGVREATVEPATEPIDAKGHALAVYTDQPQPDREIVCTATSAEPPAEGEEPPQGKEIREAALDLIVDQQGVDWHLLAVEPKGEDNVVVACAPKDGGADTALYGYAVVDGFDRADRGALIGTISLGVALAFGGLVFWQRRQAKRASAEDTDD